MSWSASDWWFLLAGAYFAFVFLPAVHLLMSSRASGSRVDGRMASGASSHARRFLIAVAVFGVARAVEKIIFGLLGFSYLRQTGWLLFSYAALATATFALFFALKALLIFVWALLVLRLEAAYGDEYVGSALIRRRQSIMTGVTLAVVACVLISTGASNFVMAAGQWRGDSRLDGRDTNMWIDATYSAWSGLAAVAFTVFGTRLALSVQRYSIAGSDATKGLRLVATVCVLSFTTRAAVNIALWVPSFDALFYKDTGRSFFLLLVFVEVLPSAVIMAGLQRRLRFEGKTGAPSRDTLGTPLTSG